MVDPDWDDPGWETAMVEKLGRADPAAPHSLSLGDLVRSEYINAAGEEAAIELSKEADRTGSPWLNDVALAWEAVRREERKREYAKALAEESAAKAAWRAKREADEAKRREAREAAAVERDKQERLYEERVAELERIARERDAEWEAGQAERDAKEAARQAEADAEWAKLGETLTGWRTEAGAKKAAKRRFDEERAILMNKWQCVKCRRVAQIKADGGAYLMSCVHCGIEGRGTHRTLVGMLPAAVQ